MTFDPHRDSARCCMSGSSRRCGRVGPRSGLPWSNAPMVQSEATAIGTTEHGNEEALDHGTNGPSRHGNLEVAGRRTDAVSGPRAAGVGCFGPCGDASVRRSLRTSTTADSALTARQ